MRLSYSKFVEEGQSTLLQNVGEGHFDFSRMMKNSDPECALFQEGKWFLGGRVHALPGKFFF